MKRILLISFALLLVGAGCGSSSSVSTYGSGSTVQREPENPYATGSGHYAGFEWAERTGGVCNGNSQSFNEGCEEYYRQLEQ